MDQQTQSATQFGASAANYLSSPVHAGGADLTRLAALAGQSRSLDLGCGAGHASFALARGGAREVIAYDPSAEMLAVVAREAAARGSSCIVTRQGAAESLPFEDRSFDLIATRFSAHHWVSVPRALAECARVLRPGGRLVVIDVVAPETPLLDTALQVIEFLRDASHVRDYRCTEWAGMLRAAGFAVAAESGWKLPMDFPSWIARIGTPPARVDALRAVFAALPSEATDYFAVDAGFSFAIDAASFECQAPPAARPANGAPGVAPKGAPGSAPGDANKAAPGDAPKGARGDATTGARRDTHGDAPAEAPGDAPKGAPGDARGGARKP